MERPFTGMLWSHDETGFYHCVVCNTRLFTFDSKFKSKTGLATFWRCVENRVTIIDDDKQVNFDNVNYARNKANL
jgi:peptide-methionine (R)-S-oxide reductase